MTKVGLKEKINLASALRCRTVLETTLKNLGEPVLEAHWEWFQEKNPILPMGREPLIEAVIEFLKDIEVVK